jgi:hypothetical protein
LKKPSYRSYKKKVKEKHVEIPKEIDTREAEQLVDDIYRLGEFIKKHQLKFLAAAVILILSAATYWGYRYYTISREVKAASIVDRGIFNLENGKTDDAVRIFELAEKKYFNTPSGKIAAFLFGKLSNSTGTLEKLSREGSFTLSPAAKIALAVNYIEKGNLNKAEEALLSVKRSKDWTYPESLYYLIIINLKKGNRDKAEELMNILSADYANSLYSQLAQELMR